MSFFDSLLQGVTGSLTGNPFGVISGIGGLVTSAIGASGSKKQADASLAATRETNEQNYKIWQEQKQHEIDMFNLENDAAIDMWNMQNAYNNPAAQAARLSGAGFNPYLSMGGSNPSGSATSAPQVGSIGASPAPTMQAPDPSAFGSALTYFAERSVSSFNQLAQATSTLGMVPSQIDVNKSIAGFNDAKTWTEKNYGWKLVREQLRAAIESREFNEETKEVRKAQLTANLNATVAATAGQMLNNAQIDIINTYIGAEKWYQINLMGVRLLNLQKEGMLLDLDLKTFMTNFISRLAVNKSIVDANNASANASNAAARLNNANAYDQELHNRVTQATFTPEMAEELGQLAAENIKTTYLFQTGQMQLGIDDKEWIDGIGRDVLRFSGLWNTIGTNFISPAKPMFDALGSGLGKKAPVHYHTGTRYTTINN